VWFLRLKTGIQSDYDWLEDEITLNNIATPLPGCAGDCNVYRVVGRSRFAAE
jgi:hypothetical protein